ncbi:MAG: hypothetical protein ACPL25_09780 [Ignavibacteria bacterium]
MKVTQISKLLGFKVGNENKKETSEISINILTRIIELFKNQTFGLFTFYGINPQNYKFHQQKLQACENFISLKGLNFIKISAQWSLKFREVNNFKEIGYFILEPTFDDMIELTKRFDQDLFVFGSQKNIGLFYSSGNKIELEPDKMDFGGLANKSVILNFVDFKLFIDSIFDFNFNFKRVKEIKINDRIIVFAKNKLTSNFHLELAEVYDIRQNGIISFERSKTTPAISPKVFHFDEIIWTISLNKSNVKSNEKVYRKAI